MCLVGGGFVCLVVLVWEEDLILRVLLLFSVLIRVSYCVNVCFFVKGIKMVSLAMITKKRAQIIVDTAKIGRAHV